MGFFSDILNKIKGNALNSENHNQLLDSVIGMISNPQTGGLQGLIEKFKQNGLGELVTSWISTGKNLPVTTDQLQQAFGQGQIQKIAQKLGLDPSLVSQGLSKILPQVVDKLTPTGNLPAQNELEKKGLSVLKDKLGR